MSLSRKVVIAAALAIIAATTIALHGQAPPAYSELEKLAIENVNLRDELRKALLDGDRCRTELAGPRNESLQQDLGRRVQALRALIEANHPGWTWDPTSGVFTHK